MSVLNTVVKGGVGIVAIVAIVVVVIALSATLGGLMGAAIAAAYNWLFATSVPLVKAALAGSIVSVASGSAAAASSQ